LGSDTSAQRAPSAQEHRSPALALDTGQRRGDLLRLTRAHLTGEGIVFTQGKTGSGVLVAWTEHLEKSVGRAKALKPQVPGEYLLRTRNGGPYSARGFSAILQRFMHEAVGSSRDGAARALDERFKFHDLRAKCASDNVISVVHRRHGIDQSPDH